MGAIRHGVIGRDHAHRVLSSRVAGRRTATLRTKLQEVQKAVTNRKSPEVKVMARLDALSETVDDLKNHRTWGRREHTAAHPSRRAQQATVRRSRQKRQ